MSVDGTTADPVLVLVAHGTRNARGVQMVADMAEVLARQVGTTRVAFVDVLGPSPSEVLRELSEPAVVVPAFLASGYHVHTDVPREIAESNHGNVVVTRALGPDPVLAEVMFARLRDAGWQPGEAVVLAAAGSSDRRALLEHRRAASMLADRTRAPVRIGYVATATPTVAEAVSTWRRICWRAGFFTIASPMREPTALPILSVFIRRSSTSSLIDTWRAAGSWLR